MSSRSLQVAAATLSALVMIASANAQQTTSPPATGAAGTASPKAGKSDRMVKDADASHPLKAVRLSKLDGVDLFDANNKKVGEIDDVMVDAKSGAVHQLVLETGGVAGVGAKKHTSSLGDLKLFSKSADDNAPAKATLAKGLEGLPAAKKMAKDSPYVEADDYLDRDVVDASGKKIGELEDLVIDLSSGQALYALVEFDKSWSPKDKLFAFKPSDLLPGKGKAVQVNATRETLDQLPSLDKNALDKSDLSRMPTTGR
jgi:sporulation protein YlmC with PRC-barrel domain